MNTSISVLLEHKGRGAVSVPPTMTVTQAAEEMRRRKVGSVLVLDGGRLAGIFTERDVLWRVVAAGLDPKTTLLDKVMTRDPITIEPTTAIQHVMNVFTEKRFRHMPVLEGGRLMGLISIGDVLRWAAVAHRQESEQLKQYITGGYPS